MNVSNTKIGFPFLATSQEACAMFNKQCIEVARRFGQVKPVSVYRFQALKSTDVDEPAEACTTD